MAFLVIPIVEIVKLFLRIVNRKSDTKLFKEKQKVHSMAEEKIILDGTIEEQNKSLIEFFERENDFEQEDKKD